MLVEDLAAAAAAEPAAPPAPIEGEFRLVHHAYDDSVFIDNDYVIRGVAGACWCICCGGTWRRGAPNSPTARSGSGPSCGCRISRTTWRPRLLLLRQRLEERAAPVRLARAGRGLIRLDLSGRPRIDARPG